MAPTVEERKRLSPNPRVLQVLRLAALWFSVCLDKAESLKSNATKDSQGLGLHTHTHTPLK